MRTRGNCYVAAEALWHILGGRRGPWLVMRMPCEGDTHWFLLHRTWETILDPSRRQFKTPPDYRQAKRAGFLTKKPSKRAWAMMSLLTWQDGTNLAIKPRTRRVR